jgi:hypothetical protein
VTKKVIYFVGNTPMLVKWMQIEMGKTLKIIKVDYNKILFSKS